MMLYHIYTANALRTIAKNGGFYPADSFYDLLQPNPTDNRPIEQIVADIIKRAKEGVG